VASVFISYRQENSDHSRRVREFALKLRAAGIDVTHDGLAQEELFHGNQPPNGWGLWSIQQASHASSVLVIGSEGWFRVLNSPEPPPDGKGAAAEATCVFQRLYSGGAANEFAAVGFFDYANDLKTLPPYMESKCGRFDLTKDEHFARLVTWLNRPITAAPVSPPVTTTTTTTTTAAPPPTPAIGPAATFPDPVIPLDRTGFVDCRPAFDAFERLLARDARRRVLLLEADGEHGKSELIRRFWRYALETLPAESASLISFPEAKDIQAVETYLTDIVDHLGAQPPAGANTHEKTRSLLLARAGRPTLILVDHYEHTLPQHADWLAVFLNRIIPQPHLRIVIAGRRVPAHLVQPWGVFAEHVHCDPFTEPDAFVRHAAACGSTMQEGEIKACCSMMQSARDARKRNGHSPDGFSPLTVITEIKKYSTGGATA